jgi:hypothetical protein
VPITTASTEKPVAKCYRENAPSAGHGGKKRHQSGRRPSKLKPPQQTTAIWKNTKKPAAEKKLDVPRGKGGSLKKPLSVHTRRILFIGRWTLWGRRRPFSTEHDPMTSVATDQGMQPCKLQSCGEVNHNLLPKAWEPRSAVF